MSKITLRTTEGKTVNEQIQEIGQEVIAQKIAEVEGISLEKARKKLYDAKVKAETNNMIRGISREG